jgi:molybdopterin/thiamine biosynthesis adenylyltransferase
VAGQEKGPAGEKSLLALRRDLDPGERFERSARIAWLDLPAIQATRVLVVGAGALGNEATKDLALSGFRKFTLVDPDRVVATNLNRCIFFTDDDAVRRELKVNAVRRGLMALDPGVEVDTHADRVENLPESVFEEHDIVVGCVDNVAARIHTNAHAFFHERPYIDGGTLGMVGKVQVVLPPHSACLQCGMNKTHMAEVARRYSCTGAGMTFVEAAQAAEITTTSIVAAVQAREAVKVASRRRDRTVDNLWYYDGLRGTAEVLRVPRNPTCPVHTAPVSAGPKD